MFSPSPSSATRVAAALCHPSLREIIRSYLMSGEETHSDEVLAIFKDEDLQVHRPGYMDTDDHDPHGRIDPYSCDYESRDAAWVFKTWKEYIRPKYYNALSMWRMETGARRPNSFVNYCGGDTWLAGVYGIDMNAHFILASTLLYEEKLRYEEEVFGYEYVDEEEVEVCGDR